eukprot:TRINITY_DN28263_c0_g7_i1.p1 TRINITY_DN28263_c0_g7~~TRINITY_DN28263_c0_g7_i1.p1  ORF type:complete len:1163 (-),score=223.38 TRINITY_DN28263_c0_g7_i1:89-3238(-)
MVPNISRKDPMISFDYRLAFKLQRCGWERDLRGIMSFDCRGSEALLDSFAVRWTGYISVKTAGDYTFEYEADDGGRIMIGNNRCPGILCGTWTDVMNMNIDEVATTNYRDDSRGKWCELCRNSPGSGGDCWVTKGGCEPYALWWLEHDGGRSGTCSTGVTKTSSTRYLARGIHPFRAEFFQRGGEARAILRWQGPDSGGKMVRIPPSAFRYPDHRGLNAEFFEIPKKTESLAPIASRGAPPPGAKFLRVEIDRMTEGAAGAGYLSKRMLSFMKPVYVRWSGTFEIKTRGTYKFFVESDDGCRLTIGGRGVLYETVVTEAPGIRNTFLPSKTGEIYLTAGRQPLRLELFFIPRVVDDNPFMSRTQPGIRIQYSGPDTGATEAVDSFKDLASNGGRNFVSRDGSCSERNFDLGGGLSMTRDCAGTCFDTKESAVGDWVCEDGSRYGMLDLVCPAWQEDGNDCEERPAPIKTTPRPLAECLISAPSSNFLHHNENDPDCRPGGTGVCKQREQEGCTPDEDDPDSCVYSRCCVAHLFNVHYWGTMCLAYGAGQGMTCETALQDIVYKERRRTDLYIESTKVPAGLRHLTTAGPQVSGKVLKECMGDLCNEIPNDFVLDPQTLDPTSERVCPAMESEKRGIECYEGPWEVTGITDPYNECQNGKYEWNFCKNRETPGGMPFVRCCAFAYVNPKGKQECLFRGLPPGPTNCGRYLQELEVVNARSPFTRIAQSMVVKDCTRSRCNNPKDKEEGCPEAVDEYPAATARDRPEGDKVESLEELLAGAGEAQTDGPPWAIIGVGIGGVALLALILFVLKNMVKEVEAPMYHSSKAKVLSDHTFVEPENDKEFEKLGLGDSKYGVVKPRQFGLRMLIEEEHFRVPKDVRDRRAAEALALANEAWAAANPPPVHDDGDRSSSSATTALATYEDKQEVRRSQRKSRLSLAAIERANRPRRLKLPGQLVDPNSDEDYAREPSPMANASALALALPDAGSQGPAGQALAFHAVDGPMGEWSIALAEGHPEMVSKDDPAKPTPQRSAASARMQRQGRAITSVAL